MRRLLFPVPLLLLLAAAARAQWSENFDSYALNSQVAGQGGWEARAAGTGALVSNAQSLSPGHSVAVVGATDLVHQYTGYTSGRWTYRVHVFVPWGTAGSTCLTMWNTYVAPGGPYSRSIQLVFNNANGLVSQLCGGTTLFSTPFLGGQWAEVKVVLDLDLDWVQIYYFGVLFDDPAVPDHPLLGGGYRWSLGDTGTNPAGRTEFAAIELFANNAGVVYYDDLSLSPFEYETIAFGCWGSLSAAHLTCQQPPRVGQTMIVLLDHLPHSTAYMTLGFSRLTSPLGPLPLNLGAFGMPGCRLHTSLDWGGLLAGAGGTATHVLAIPNLPVLLDVTFFEQALVPDAASGRPLGAVMSDAAMALIGR